MSAIALVQPVALTVGRRNLVFVRIRTADGVEGIGEGTIPHKARALIGTVQDFAEYLLGKDSEQIERHWQALYRHSFHRAGPIMMTALSAIEQALWDIRGRELNQPVWNLLGGAVRDRLKVYTHAGGPAPAAAAERALELMEEGYRALKLGIPGSVEPVLEMRPESGRFG